MLVKMVRYIEHYVEELFHLNRINDPLSTDRRITKILKDLRISKIDLEFVNFLQSFWSVSNFTLQFLYKLFYKTLQTFSSYKTFVIAGIFIISSV